MGFFDGIAKIFPQLFDNPTLIYVLVGIMILIGYFYFKKGEGKMPMKLFYFADVERLVSPLDIKEVTPKSIYTKDDKRFMRRAKSYLYKDGTQTFIMFLGKVGKGLTYRLEQNKEEGGKVVIEKIGNLYDGLKACLNVEEMNELTPQTFTPETLKLLKQSEISVCVDLEEHTSKLPDITEEGAVTEANKSMAELVGMKIRQQMHREDWIKNGGLMAIGAVVYILAVQLGLI